MVWQTFTYFKNANSDENLTSPSSQSSLSSSSMPNTSDTINQNKSSSSSSSKRSPSPRPPPRFHRPTSKSSAQSDFHNNDNNNTSDYAKTFHNDLPFSITPAGRFFTHFFDETMQYFNYPMHNIAWSEEPPTINAYYGNSINEKIIDNDEKFAIEIDLSDFLAGELLINYNEEERELSIEGHQKGRNGRVGSTERNFERKFDIPSDVHDGSLAAYLVPSGLLTVQAFKKGIKQPIRRIPIQEVADVPNSVEKNAAKVPTFETSKNTTNKNTGPPVPPKPNKVSKQKPSTIEEVSKEAEKIPEVRKLKKDDEKQLNFDQKPKPTKESVVKREYLNIFC
uniref:SHSP domain-containing protein n=1 Tax=Onchocerca volvulus TaxID=6282 RepID=A0A8R1XMG2_ONCVO